MKIIRSIQQFQLYRSRLQNKQIGFIPTMGALHAGHLSLVEQSLDDFQHTIVSIFINPTQFDNKNDLNHFPNLLEQDIEKLKQAGVKCVFLPNFD
ncbi:MAG TPA: pantoate--beta-alanine ligase, partial [Oceanospirillales bacterium]|nr:pantoate--beta-alanine ligase [Oceanospirillales bacterium]